MSSNTPPNITNGSATGISIKDPASTSTTITSKPRPHRSASTSSTTSSASATSSVLTKVESRIQTYLLHFFDLPPWRRDNPSILTGYRPESNSYLRSVSSLFYLHNESVNIWTHLLGSLIFSSLGIYLLWQHVVAPRYSTANSSDRLVFSCFFAGATMCLGMSATYHMLCNHSETVAKWGNKLDYSGIVVLIVGSYVPALYYALFCRPALMSVYLYLICLLGLACMTVSWLEHFRTPAFRTFRASMFVGLGLSGVVPVVHGLLIYGFKALNEKMGLTWVLLQGALYITGAGLYAARVPEKHWPGKFDIWGSSHQIFHCFVLAAAAAHLRGMEKAFDHHHLVMGSECSAEAGPF